MENPDPNTSTGMSPLLTPPVIVRPRELAATRNIGPSPVGYGTITPLEGRFLGVSIPIVILFHHPTGTPTQYK